jgi:PAS domain S-box-containing protein
MEFLETLWEDSVAGNFLARTDGTILRINAAFSKVFGYANDEVMKHGLSFYFGGVESFDEVMKLIQNKKSLKNYLVKSSGSSGAILFKMNARLIIDSDGNEQIMGSIMDLTELSLTKRNQLETQKIFQDLFENSLELIQSFDISGRLLFCNKTWHEKLEYSAEELSTITLFDIIADEHKPHCQEIFLSVLQGKSFTNIEVDFVTKSGKRISLEGNIVPLVRNGKLEATHGFFRDVTEKNKAMRLAAVQQKLIHTIFDSLPVCMYVKDASGKYLFANACMEQTMAKPLVGCTDIDLYSYDVLPILKKTDADTLLHPDDLISFDITINTSRGDAHYLCGKKSIEAEDGSRQLFGFAIDVTELIDNTRKIESNEQMLQFIMNNIDEGLLLFSKGNLGQYSLAFRNNKARELISNPDNTVQIDDLLKFLKLDFSKDMNFLKTGEYRCERELTTSVGPVSVIIRINEIRKNIHESNILVSLYDNTKDKNMLHEIEKKYNENIILIGEVHHRVKNNLAIIDGIFELKKAQVADISSRQLISEMQLRVRSIALVHQKLYNAIDFSTISFYDYVQDMTGYYQKLYSTDSFLDVTFDFQINKSISLDITSSISLGLLISELVSNSLKYASVEGKVKISMGLDYCLEGLCFSYSDSGPGIPNVVKEDNQFGFGFKLMQSLQKQLKGTVTFPEESHFSYRLTFPFIQPHVKKADNHR